MAFPKASPPASLSSIPTASLPWFIPRLSFCNIIGKHNSGSFQKRLLANKGCNDSGETRPGCQRACGDCGVWYGVWGSSEESPWPRAPLSSQPAVYLDIRWWSSHRWAEQRGHVAPALWILSCRGGCFSVRLSLKDPEGASSPDPNQWYSRGPLQHLEESRAVAKHVFPGQSQSSGESKEARAGRQRGPE